MQRPSSRSLMRTAGFTLVELMVAMALSLLLLAGVVAIFSSSRVAYESTDQLSRVQESGRFALDQLSRHVRGAGFTGCSRAPNFIATALNANTTATLQYNFLNSPAVLGYDGADGFTPALDASLSGLATPPAAGSDVLVVRGPQLDAVPMQISADMVNAALDPDATAALTVKSVGSINGVEDGSPAIFMAYSCEGASFFRATPTGTELARSFDAAAVPANATDSTSYPFRKSAEVVPVETVAYYVAANNLWRRIGLANPEVLVEGISMMQVEYGIDTDDDRVVDDYQAAAAATDWQNVIAVRIALLVDSVEEYGTDTDNRVYQLFGTEVGPINDRRLRQVFTTTVGIRNRVRIE